MSKKKSLKKTDYKNPLKNFHLASARLEPLGCADFDDCMAEAKELAIAGATIAFEHSGLHITINQVVTDDEIPF